MKRAIVMLAAVAWLAGLSGCTFPHGRLGTGLIHGSCQDAPEDCAACNGGCVQGDGANGAYPMGDPRQYGGDPGALGPPTAAVTYPYYTVRGPRDFLARNPQSIGP